jgi:hypothetical protein
LSGLTPPDIKKKEFFNQKPIIKWRNKWP